MESVVVLHGLWLPGWETWLLRRRLRSAGFAPFLFRFRTVSAGLAENASRLASFVAQVPGDTIHLVGYSLGGVVALEMVGAHGLDRGGRIVCLGSPLNGSRSARNLARLPLGRRMLGQSVLDLLSRGGLEPWRGQHELGTVAGNVALGLGRLLGRFGAPNDGTVAVPETELDGAADHVVLRVSHTAMLFSRVVAEQAIAFLRSGRFAHRM